jgi:hypothetical protein
MGMLERAEGKAPLCLEEFVTLKDERGLTEACSDGVLMLTFRCRNSERETVQIRKILDQAIEFEVIIFPSITLDFVALQQPVRVAEGSVIFGRSVGRYSGVGHLALHVRKKYT